MNRARWQAAWAAAWMWAAGAAWAGPCPEDGGAGSLRRAGEAAPEGERELRVLVGEVMAENQALRATLAQREQAMALLSRRLGGGAGEARRAEGLRRSIERQADRRMEAERAAVRTLLEDVRETLGDGADAAAVGEARRRVDSGLEALRRAGTGPAPAARPAERTDWRVLEVDEATGVAAVGAGAADGLRPGLALAVVRSAAVVGRLVLVEVRMNVSAAVVGRLSRGMAVEAGDRLLLAPPEERSEG